MTSEWLEWHRNYDDDPTMRRRLRAVQERIREALERHPPGPVRVISACAGDGRDLLGILATHPRASQVRACLIELAPELVRAGRERAARKGLVGADFRQGDASTSRAYVGAVPADVVMMCGIFGNVTDDDIRNTIRHLPELCARNATVIWTRGRFAPDLTPTIRGWFAETGFEELSFVTIPHSTKAVGAHRLVAAPKPFRRNVRLFTFLPAEKRPSNLSATAPPKRPVRRKAA
ncbi:MAG: class I SAM-dependent methyltransferase [Thermoplasmata archaeon]